MPNSAIRELRLTNVEAIAPTGALPTHDDYEGPCTYALYGVEAHCDGHLKRLYFVDRGTDWLVVAHDVVPMVTGPWPVETQRARRGHGFCPVRPLHQLYATEYVPTEDKIVREHYFTGGSDWWIVEAEPTPGGVRAFGYACLNGDTDMAEWGYVDLAELEQVNARRGLVIVERDLHWEPVPFSTLDMARR